MDGVNELTEWNVRTVFSKGWIMDMVWLYWVTVAFFCGFSFLLGAFACAVVIFPTRNMERSQKNADITIELMDRRNGLDEQKIEVMDAIKDRLVEIRDAIKAK